LKSSTLLRSHNVLPQNFYKFIKPDSENLINLFPQLNDIYYDLLEMIMCIYIIDKGYKSKEELIFESRNKNFWNDEILYLLNKIYEFLTVGKEIEFRIVEKKNKMSYQQTRLKDIILFKIPKESKVCLFSGGMDSSCALLNQIKEGNFIIPIHTLTNNRNLGLLRNLHRFEPFNKMFFYFADLRDISIQNIEIDTGNMRGLVYLTNAFVLSHIYGINEIIFPENGPMMINPITSIWLSPTRNAHPYFIEKFIGILKKINSDIRINYIYKDNTKAEIISKERKNELLLHTYSCFTTRQKIHCGSCYACLVRKYSSIAAKYSEPTKTYKENILTQNISYETSKIKDFHETIILYLSIINDNYDFKSNINISHIPNNFFDNYKKLLKNFSLDMIYGIMEDCNKVDYSMLNTLGKFAYDEIKELDPNILKSRTEEILST